MQKSAALPEAGERIHKEEMTCLFKIVYFRGADQAIQSSYSPQIIPVPLFLYQNFLDDVTCQSSLGLKTLSCFEFLWSSQWLP